MALGILFVGVPLITYLFLVIAPVGRASRMMIGVVGLFVLYIWVGYLMSWEPLWTGNDRADAYTLAAAIISSVAFLVGSMTAVFGRKVAARITSLSYPAVAVLILLMTLVPLFLLVGL